MVMYVQTLYLHYSLVAFDHGSKEVQPSLTSLPRPSFQLHGQETAPAVFQKEPVHPMAADVATKEVLHNVDEVKTQVAAGWTYPLDNGQAHCVVVG